MNHSVHVFIRGCLTLKFSGSWKTVRISPSPVLSLADDFSCVPSFELSTGEMGIVSSGTCCCGLGAVATSAMVSVSMCVCACVGGKKSQGCVVPDKVVKDRRWLCAQAGEGVFGERVGRGGGALEVAPGDGSSVRSSRGAVLPSLARVVEGVEAWWGGGGGLCLAASCLSKRKMKVL